MTIGDDFAPRPAFLATLVALLAALALLVVVDVTDDARAGQSHGHIAAESVAAALALLGALALSMHLVEVRWRAHHLQRSVRRMEGEMEQFRAESRAHLRGLGAAVDRQLERWSLSPAEREVGLLLLKGLSHKEIAEVRATSERTVRQQALSVYRKAGLSGRAELAAFFLVDLLGPPLAEAQEQSG
jgi:DNA-binding CsgD family transcriptional regulator